MTRRQIERRGRLYLEAVLTLEESTLQHMGPREQARFVATDTYRLPSTERDAVLSFARKLGMSTDTISTVWDSIWAMEMRWRNAA